MSDEERRSNWTDAGLVALPPCPHCCTANAPLAAPQIELVGTRALVCRACGVEWVPVKDTGHGG